MKQPETILSEHSQEALTRLGAKVVKFHGGPETEAGTPDLIGCFMCLCFAVELKQPGEKPTDIQVKRLREWREAGARVGVATTVEEVLQIVVQGLPIGHEFLTPKAVW